MPARNVIAIARKHLLPAGREVTFGGREVTFGGREVTLGRREVMFGRHEVAFGRKQLLPAGREVTFGRREVASARQNLLPARREVASVRNHLFPDDIVFDLVRKVPDFVINEKNTVLRGLTCVGRHIGQCGDGARMMASFYMSLSLLSKPEAIEMNYSEFYRASIDNPEKFWAEQAAEIKWFTPPKTILSLDGNEFFRWFDGGELNTCYLALDHHIENGRGDDIALIYDSPVTATVKKFTFSELRDDVAKFAGALSGLGVEFGDRVVIYMPMIPQAVVAMLACARIGAVHSVVFGGFAPHELALRIEDAEPKVLVTASYGIEGDRRIDYIPLANKGIAESHFKPEHLVIFRRDGDTRVADEPFEKDMQRLIDDAVPAECVPVPSWHPLYILYTSGTTGKPKGIVRDNGGHAVAMRFSMRYIYDLHPGDVFWAASDVGWVVGHSYIVYGPLINGSTTVLFEGKPIRTPDAGVFWRVISEHGVKTMFTAPTAIRAIRKEDPHAELLAKYDISCLKRIFLAGERCDPNTFHWIKDVLARPVIDHWWQTESGWPMLGIMAGIDDSPSKAGSAGFPVCGYDVRILSEDGISLGPGRDGLVAVKLPLPPGCLPNLWKTPVRFYKSYLEQFHGYYLSGDGGYIDDDGYYFIMGRVDDVINVAGHRLSTGEMEEIVASHAAVAECCVVGIADNYRGQSPMAFVITKDGVIIEEAVLESELVALIREKIGAIACFKHAVAVRQLPKTRSGKILRKTIRNIADGIEFAIPSTIDDPGSLDLIEERLRERKIGNAFADEA